MVITVAKMLTGTGESFDGTGLSVDVEAAQKVDAEGGELTLENDVQLQKALGTAKALTGGGTGGSSSTGAASVTLARQAAVPPAGESGASGEGEDRPLASAAGEPAAPSARAEPPRIEQRRRPLPAPGAAGGAAFFVLSAV